jgi:hypothetical protein
LGFRRPLLECGERVVKGRSSFEWFIVKLNGLVWDRKPFEEPRFLCFIRLFAWRWGFSSELGVQMCDDSVDGLCEGAGKAWVHVSELSRELVEIRGLAADMYDELGQCLFADSHVVLQLR